jgi:hypothetical protein
MLAGERMPRHLLYQTLPRPDLRLCLPRPKLDFVPSGTLDDKRTSDTSFAAVADFLKGIPTTSPHDLFRRDDDDLHDGRSMSRAQTEMSAAEAKA